MSSDYMSTVVVGCRVPKYKLQPKTSVRLCQHTLHNAEDIFCSRCGKKAWEEKDVPIEGYDPYHQTLLIGDKAFKVVGDESQLLVALPHLVVKVKVFGMDKLELPAGAGELEDTYRRILGDLWSPGCFGIWIISEIY